MSLLLKTSQVAKVACLDVYSLLSGAIQWELLEQVDGVYFGIQRVDDFWVVAPRGSADIPDWMRDFSAIPVWHPKLGWVHGGFERGVDAAYAAICKILPADAKVVLGGHSLGAAHAWQLAGLFAYDRKPVVQVEVFGSPRPGFQHLAHLVTQNVPTVCRSWRNLDDPVPTVPFDLPPFFSYVDPVAPGAFSQAPAPGDLEPLRDHHGALYYAGACALDNPQGATT